MLRIFRKIRQLLLAENKIRKYLLYAIGEILLIMIGILLALQVSNRNEKQKDSRAENAYLKKMRADIETDIEEFETAIRLDSLNLEAIRHLLQKFKTEELFTQEELMQNTLNNTFVASSIHRVITFDEMKSSGKLGLIKSDSLRQSIMLYYYSLSELDDVQNTNNRVIIDKGISIAIELLDFNSLIQAFEFNIPEVTPLDLSFYNENRQSNELKQYQNYLAFRAFLVTTNDFWYRKILADAIKVSSEIERYLDDK